MSNITNRRNESLPNYKKKEKGTVFIPKEQEGYVISLLNTMFSSRNNSNQIIAILLNVLALILLVVIPDRMA